MTLLVGCGGDSSKPVENEPNEGLTAKPAMSDTILLFAKTYADFTKSYTMPASISIDGVQLSQGRWFELAARMLQTLDDDKPLTDIQLQGFASGANRWGYDTFDDDSIGLDGMRYMVDRQLEYAAGTKTLANYVNFTAASKTPYTGRMSEGRGLVLLMRFFAEYERKGALPNRISASFSDFLHPTKNCDPAGANAVAAMTAATAGKTTVAEKAQAIFTYARDALEYEYYSDTRYGSEGTLTQKKGNCCDLSHAIVAMARAAGIPARYIHGVEVQFSSSIEGHVWTELLVDGKWVICDASNNKNTYGHHENFSVFTLRGRLAELWF